MKLSLVQDIMHAYYVFTKKKGMDYGETGNLAEGKSWDDVDIFLMDGMIWPKNEAVAKDLEIVGNFRKAMWARDRTLRRWNKETEYAARIGSHSWHAKQTVSIDETSLQMYLEVAGIPLELQTADMLELAKQDILIRRARDEINFKTSRPLRKAFERCRKTEKRLHERFPVSDFFRKEVL